LRVQGFPAVKCEEVSTHFPDLPRGPGFEIWVWDLGFCGMEYEFWGLRLGARGLGSGVEVWVRDVLGL